MKSEEWKTLKEMLLIAEDDCDAFRGSMPHLNRYQRAQRQVAALTAAIRALETVSADPKAPENLAQRIRELQRVRVKMVDDGDDHFDQMDSYDKVGDYYYAKDVEALLQ